MFALPPLQSWDALHPLVVHFPIVLLMVAPLFVVLGVLLPRSGRAFLVAALVLMVLGTVSVYVAVPTGEATAELADRSPEINAVLEHHEELAETTRTLFTILTVIFAVIVIGPGLLRRKLDRAPAAALSAVFLVFYLAGTLVLVNTAHQGGRLVHEYGVQALIDGGPAPAPGEVMTHDSDDVE